MEKKIAFKVPVSLFVPGKPLWSQLNWLMDIPAYSQVKIGNLLRALDYINPDHAPDKYKPDLFIACKVDLPDLGQHEGYILHHNLEHASEEINL